jgi:hypothetical protein
MYNEFPSVLMFSFSLGRKPIKFLFVSGRLVMTKTGVAEERRCP